MEKQNMDNRSKKVNSIEELEEFLGFPNPESEKRGEKMDKRSKMSKSVTGTRRSSLSSKQVLMLQLETKKKIAALEEEKAKKLIILEEEKAKKLIILEEERIQREKELLEMELKIRLSQAGSSICTDVDEKSTDENSLHDGVKDYDEENDIQKVNSWLEKTDNHVKTDGFNRIKDSNSYEDKLEKILYRQTIDTELPIFFGNVKEWPNFYNQYSYTTKVLCLSEEENLCRLRKCLKGDARRSVEGLLIFPTAHASSVIDILKNKFGRPDVIVRTLVNETKSLPPVKNNDFVALAKFSETVTNLMLTFESLDMQNYLSCPQLMDELMQKLPYNLQLSWGEKIARNQGKYTLKDFKIWIGNKAEAASYVQGVVLNRTPPNSDKFKRTMTMTKNYKQRTSGCSLCREQHGIEKCKKFLEMPLEEKWRFVKDKNMCFCCLRFSHKIFQCRMRKKCGIGSCQKMHHSILHFENNQHDEERRDEDRENISNQIVAHTAIHSTQILLKIAPVILKSASTQVKTYALFDEGSTVTLIDENLANELQLDGIETTLDLRWTDSSSRKRSLSRKVCFEISGEFENTFYEINNVYTFKDMDLPIQTINTKHLRNKWKHLEQVKFADMSEVQPKLLIGQDYWNLITTRKLIEGPKNSPALSYTKLGWIIHGNINQFKGRVDNLINLHIKHENKDEELHNLVKYFFTTEALGVKYSDKKKQSIEDEIAEDLLKKVSERNGDRWQTGLLWRDEDQELPDSKPLALRRFQYIEKRMAKDQEFAEAYRMKIKEYEEKNYAKKLDSKEIDSKEHKIWYLPHFAVVNPNKPGKMRFVFDAAAKVDGKSLNEFLLKGPDLYNSLVGIIWKFRENPIAFCADIREMFHQVLIRKEDQNAQRFLWRSFPEEEIQTYAMQVMIFGAVSSPYSAQFIKNINALEFQQKYPQAVEAIINRHYMDDYLDSAKTPEEAIRLINEIIFIHKKGGFDLRGWVCNSEQVFNKIPEEVRSTEKIFRDSDTPQRILGLKWEPKQDILSFPLNLHKVDQEIIVGQKIPTKRQMLTVIMSLFDPLGILGHFIVQGKILMQEIWRSGLNWDDQISNLQNKKWIIWLDGLEKVRYLKIPRCYNINNSEVRDIQLHIFCDASEQAFSAVAYFRFGNEQKVHVSLVMSRNQVAPLKHMTIPRLELQAAVMASRLAKTIEKDHTWKINRMTFWCDSMTVLSWLRSETRRYPPFVHHRIGEILENTDVFQWRWVPSKLNVADEATRNDREINLDINNRWFRGPEFLYLQPCFWPEEKKETDLNLNLEKIVLINISNEESFLPDISRFSSWIKLIRSTAYVLKFIKLCQKKENKKIHFSLEDLRIAEKMWCLKVQKESFPEEYRLLAKGKVVSQKSYIYRLSPCLSEGLICIDGRIDNSTDLDNETKKPIILNNRHLYTRLLIKHCHERNKHAGLQLVLNEIRQRFWIIQARKTITAVINMCNFCKIQKAKPKIPEMGKLPAERLRKPLRAFMYVGVDYFGPMEVTVGRRKEKKYGVLFTCLSVRAVHLEIAASLNTDSAMLAIRRFISRRGQPSIMWSDNGTNLTAANKELKEALRNIDANKIERHLLTDEIEWKFIPPGSPHMGGAWERMVRCVKKTLKVILKDRTPKFEVLQTLLVEVEHIVNSRPLTYVSSSENDLESLTPNHFLIGTSSIVKPIGVFQEKINIRKQWQFVQQLSENFWRRWLIEYLPTLISRSKWLSQNRNVREDDMVILMDNQLPRNNWPLGRIVGVYPGSDGKIRVVDVMTKTGTYRRPISKICPIDFLEMSNSEEITEGENVGF